ncbi:MAG: phosphoesterase [Methanospirillum sp.]|nr:phosphoesterase [Methanospirillum sp.]
MSHVPTLSLAEERVVDAARERRASVVHLTHNDLDAVGADAIHRRRYGDVFTVFSSVGKFPAFLERLAALPGRGDLLSISDLGYREPALSSLEVARASGWRVEWRDHHRWDDDEQEAVRARVDLLRVDTATCGCGIVARDLLPGDSVAREIAGVVCDYDLWLHLDPRSAVLGQVLQRPKNRNHVRDLLARGRFTDAKVEAEYAEIRDEMSAMIDRSVAHVHLAGERYRVAFAPLYGYPSETAAAIRERLGTEVEVIVNGSGRFSIRSVPPISHLVARRFGGGGHPHAAGGDFTFTFIERVGFALLHRTRRFRDLVAAADAL